MTIETIRGVFVTITGDRPTSLAYQEWVIRRSAFYRREFAEGRFISCGGDHYVAFVGERDSFEVLAWLRDRQDGITIGSKVDEAILLLREIGRNVSATKKDIEHMTPELKALSDQVAANTAVEASAVALIKGLADQIAASKDDPAAIAALSAQLKASAGDLAASVAANTAPPPPAPPATEPAPAAP